MGCHPLKGRYTTFTKHGAGSAGGTFRALPGCHAVVKVNGVGCQEVTA